MRIVGLFLLAIFIGFQFASAQTNDCEFNDFEKAFVEDAIQKFVLDTIFTAGSGIHPNGFPTKGHVAYASTLLGQIRSDAGNADPGIRESASLTGLCTRPKVFNTICRSSNGEPADGRFWKEHDVCVEISCEAKGVYKAEISWTPIPAQSRFFTYNATSNREITYDPAPYVIWRLNDRIAGRLIVTGELVASAKLKHQNGKTVRATYTGNATAVSSDEEGLTSLVLNMTFPGLRSLTPLRAELLLHRHDASSANGTIQQGDNTLADLTLLPGQPLVITWVAACE